MKIMLRKYLCHRQRAPLKSIQRTSLSVAMLSCLSLPLNAWATDYSFSGFGTLGYGITDQSYNYQRHLNDKGGFERDTVLGAQMDVHFNNQFGATLQVKAASSQDKDNRTDLSTSWVFASWRPNNDWLVRAGKLRVPTYLYSESMDVGTTYDMARLPLEVYSLSPSTDFTGLFLSRTWSGNNGDWNLDGYWGNANMKWRFYHRDPIPGIQEPGAFFTPIKVESAGLALSFRNEDDIFRAAFHQVRSKPDGVQFVGEFGYSSIPGLTNGYYDINSATHPGIIRSNSFVLSASVAMPHNFRVTGEAVRRVVQDTSIGPDTLGAYISISNSIGPWTPYVTYAFLRSQDSELSYYQAVNSNTVAAAAPVPALIAAAQGINASQRALADGMVAYDQRSWALGFSYALSPTSKIKAEWQRVHINQASSLVDAPSGSNISNTSINVLSASYNFVF